MLSSLQVVVDRNTLSIHIYTTHKSPMVQEPRESVEHTQAVEHTQDSSETIQESQSNNANGKTKRAKSIGLKVGGVVAGASAAIGGLVFFLNQTTDLLENANGLFDAVKNLSNSIGVIETAEQTEPYVAVFKTRNGDREKDGDEQLQLSFQDGNVKGSSISTFNNVDKEWDYLGYTDGSYLALAYREKNTPVFGTVLMRKRAEGEYIGYWEGKLCSDSNAVVKCPYALVKGNSRSSMSPEQETHLDKPCIDTVFDGNSGEASAGNPCS